MNLSIICHNTKQLLFRIILLICSFVIHASVLAQSSSKNVIMPGKVIIEDDTINGNLEMDFRRDIVLCHYQNKIFTYSAFQATAVHLIDSTKSSEQVYISVDFKDMNGFKRRIFVENLVEGKFTLYRQQRIIVRDEVISYYPYVATKREQMITYLYYLDQKGPLKSLPLKKKLFLKIFGAAYEQIEAFVKDKKLNFRKEKDIIAIFEYYNALK